MRALLLAALLTAGPALAATPTPEAMTKKEQGDARRDAGDPAAALAAYREALRLSPGYVEAWEEIGKVHFAAKRFSEAADAFQRAVDIDGSYPNNWFNLSLAARRAGDNGLAREGLRRYLELKPSDHDARLRFAEVLRALGERATALREYEAVLAAAEARSAPQALGDRAKPAIEALRAEEGAAKARVTIVPVVPPAPEATTAPSAAPASVVASAQTPLPAAPALPYPAPAALPAGPAAEPQAVQGSPAVSAPAAPPRPAEPLAPPSPALLDKLALGDRLQASGDYRGALFAFQDAVYLDPRHAVARARLGRAYWTLRYVGQAEEQWQQATQLAPNDASIARMIEEARKAPRPALPSGETVNGASAGQGNGTPAAGGSGTGPRLYKLAPDSQGAPTLPPAQPQGIPVAGSTPGYGLPPAPAQPQPQYGQPYAPAPYAQPAPQYAQPAPQYAQPAPQYAQPAPQYAQPAPQYAQPAPQYAQPAPQYAQPAPQYAQPAPQYPQPAPVQPGYAPPGGAAYAPPPPSPEPAPAAPTQPAPAAAAAAQRYRTAISHYIQRNYLAAVAELDAAITLDPSLAVAYTARGSSRFGLGRYREAAADYRAALDLDATKAEPIWGLAECQRMLKDPAAPETYRRYAASIAGDVNEDRRDKARRWATELSAPRPPAP